MGERDRNIDLKQHSIFINQGIDAGDANAMDNVAQMFRLGTNGVENDPKKSFIAINKLSMQDL